MIKKIRRTVKYSHSINAIIEDKIIISIKDIQVISLTAFSTLKQLFSYRNPKYIENEKWGYSNYSTPEYLYSYKVSGGKIYINRGGKEKIVNQFNKFGISINFIDRTLVTEQVDYSHSKTVLRTEQIIAADSVLKFENGLMQCPTSFGKTVTLLEIVRRLGMRAVIMVHTTFIQKQWIKEATNKSLFNIPINRIGGVGGVFLGPKRRLRDINVCLYHSLAKKEHLDFFSDKVGIVIFDEGQKASIEDIQLCTNAFRARYRYGASASFHRKDGKEFLIYDTFGPVRYVAVEKEGASKIISNINLVKTNYSNTDYEDDRRYTALISDMAYNYERNIVICRRVLKQVKQNKLCIIFVERKIQAAILAKYLSKYRVGLLLGPVNKKDVDEFNELSDNYRISDSVINILKNYDDKKAYDVINKSASNRKLDIIIGTQKAEVGLSIRTIDYGLVTTPVGNNLERLNQIKGRLERTHSDEQVELFGVKEKPLLEVLLDRTRPSRNSALAIKEKYEKVKVIKIQ